MEGRKREREEGVGKDGWKEGREVVKEGWKGGRKKERRKKRGRQGRKDGRNEGRKKERREVRMEERKKESKKERREGGREGRKEGRRFTHLNNRQNFQYHNKDQDQERSSTCNIRGNGKTGFVLYSITIQTHFPQHTASVRCTFGLLCLSATFLLVRRITVIYNITLIAFLQLLHYFNVVQFRQVLISIVLASLHKAFLIIVKL